MTQPLSILYAQQSVLEQFHELQKEGRHPQLGIYRSKSYEQLFLYSYDCTSLLDKISQLFAKVAYYALSYFGKVDFNPDGISHLQKTIGCGIEKKSLDIAGQSKESSIKNLNEQETRLKASEAQLLASIKTLSQQEEELKRKKNDIESNLSSLQKDYDEKIKVIEEGTRLSQQMRNLEGKLERTKIDTRDAELSKASLSEELKKLEQKRDAINNEIRGLLPQTQTENLKRIQHFEATLNKLGNIVDQKLLANICREFLNNLNKASELQKYIFPDSSNKSYQRVQHLCALVAGAVYTVLKDELNIFTKRSNKSL